MRHNVKGRKLNRDRSHRRALLSNLASELFKHKRITTTLAKAKEARSVAERMITFGKKGDIASLRHVMRRLNNKEIVYHLFNDIAPRFKERNGGYTRVLKTGFRKGDAAPLAILELVDFDYKTEKLSLNSAKTQEKTDQEAETVEAEEIK